MFSYHFLVSHKSPGYHWKWWWDHGGHGNHCSRPGVARYPAGELVPTWMGTLRKLARIEFGGAIKTETLPGLLDNMKIYIYQSWSVPFWQIRKFVDPAVFYWTSPLLYIGKNTFFPTDHITQPKKQKKTNGLATHWVPTLGGAAEVSNEFSIRPYLVQQETIRGIKFTFRPTRSRGVGISTYEVLERSHKNS